MTSFRAHGLLLSLGVLVFSLSLHARQDDSAPMMGSDSLSTLGNARCPQFTQQFEECQQSRKKIEKVCNNKMLSSTDESGSGESQDAVDEFSCKNAGLGSDNMNGEALATSSCHTQRAAKIRKRIQNCEQVKDDVDKVCTLKRGDVQNMKMLETCVPVVQELKTKIANDGAQLKGEIDNYKKDLEALAQSEETQSRSATHVAGQSGATGDVGPGASTPGKVISDAPPTAGTQFAELSPEQRPANYGDSDASAEPPSSTPKAADPAPTKEGTPIEAKAPAAPTTITAEPSYKAPATPTEQGSAATHTSPASTSGEQSQAALPASTQAPAAKNTELNASGSSITTMPETKAGPPVAATTAPEKLAAPTLPNPLQTATEKLAETPASAPANSTNTNAPAQGTTPTPNNPRASLGGGGSPSATPGGFGNSAPNTGEIADNDPSSSKNHGDSEGHGGSYGSRAKRAVESMAMGLFVMAGNLIGNSNSSDGSSTNITVVNNNYNPAPVTPNTPPSNESPVTPITPPVNPSNPPGGHTPVTPTPPIASNPADPNAPNAPTNPNAPATPGTPVVPPIGGVVNPTNPLDPSAPPVVAAKAGPNDKAVAAGVAGTTPGETPAADGAAEGRAPASVSVNLGNGNAQAHGASTNVAPGSHEGATTTDGGEASMGAQATVEGANVPADESAIGSSVKKLIAWVSGEPAPAAAPRLLNTAVGGFTGKQLHAASADMFGKIQNRYKALEPTLIKDP